MQNLRWRIGGHDVDLRLASPAARVAAAADPTMERCRISRYQDAETCQRLAEQVAIGQIPAQTGRDVVWRDWLSALADHFTEVTIYDPYLSRQFVDGGPQAKTNGVAACLWLIAKLGATELPHRVTILTLAQQSGRQEVDNAFAAMESTLSGVAERGTIESIRVVVGARRGSHGADALARPRGRNLHDRYIRFSGGSRTEAAIVLPSGLDRLGRDPLTQDLNLQYRPEFRGMSSASLEGLREQEEIILAAVPGALGSV